MPYYHLPTLQEQYPREWEKLLKEISKQMIIQGWNKHARKFREVMVKKAKKLFTMKCFQ